MQNRSFRVTTMQNISNVVTMQTSVNGVTTEYRSKDMSPSAHDRLQQLNDDLARELLPAMVFVGVLMFFGIVGNLLVCFVYGFRLRMGTQHFLILTLAALDLLTCFIAMPTEIVDMRYYVMFESEFACRLLKFTGVFSCLGSSFVLVLIAVDRYIKICRPWSQQMSLRKTKMAAGIVLLVACVFAFPSPLLAGNPVYDMTYDGLVLPVYPCSADGSDDLDTYYYFIYNAILLVGFLALVVVLSVLYVLIWRMIKTHNRRISRRLTAAKRPAAFQSSLEPSSSSPAPDAATNTPTKVRTHKTTVIAVLVTVVFVLSYVPFFALKIVTESLEEDLRGDKLVLFDIFLRFPFFNAVANPFIYSALNPAFRAECFKLFTWIPFCKRSVEVQSSTQTEHVIDSESEKEHNENDIEMATITSSS